MRVLLGIYWSKDGSLTRWNDTQADLGDIEGGPISKEIQAALFAAKMELIKQVNARRKSNKECTCGLFRGNIHGKDCALMQPESDQR